MEVHHHYDLLHGLKIEYVNCQSGLSHTLHLTVNEQGEINTSTPNEISNYHLIIIDILLNHVKEKMDDLLERKVFATNSPIGE